MRKETEDACAVKGSEPHGPVDGKSRRHEKEKKTKAVIARGIHLYPFRTEKLSHAAPMVLRKRESRSPPH